MENNLEKVLELIAEGGSISILKKKKGNNFVFTYHTSETDPSEEDFRLSETREYTLFPQAFKIINKKFTWYNFHLEEVGIQYKSFIAEQLVLRLNSDKINEHSPFDSRKNFEEKLGIKLVFGQIEIPDDIYNIEVSLFNGTTTNYEYRNLSGEYYASSVRSDDLKIDRIVENLDKTLIKTKGKIQVDGSTIIILNVNGNIDYVFSSSNALVTTSPINRSAKQWFFDEII